jgi:hypothetical protein
MNGGWIVAAAYDTKLANQFVERFGAAFRVRDIDAIAALLHPEGRESQRDFFLSCLKATVNENVLWRFRTGSFHAAPGEH